MVPSKSVLLVSAKVRECKFPSHFTPEKQMIFLLVLILAVSTRCIPGRCTIFLTSTGGGVTAMGAMLDNVHAEISKTGQERLIV